MKDLRCLSEKLTKCFLKGDLMINNSMMGNYYSRFAFITKIIRYFCTLAFILFLLSCILIFRNDITIENIQLITKHITFGAGSSAAYTDEFPISANESSEVFMVRDNLAVVDKSGISLYELSGQKLFNFRYAYSTPAAVSDKHHTLVYDINGDEIAIYNSFSRVYTEKFPYSVRCADINENGFAVVSNAKTYRSSVYVYNSDYNKRIFEYYSADNYITSLALSQKARELAISCVSSDDGSFDSSIKLFDVRSQNPTHTFELPGEMPVKIGYSSDEENIFAITDSNIHFFTSKLKNIKSYKFNQSKTDFYRIKNDIIVLTEKNNLSGNSMKVIGFKTDGSELFSLDVNDELYDLAIGNDKMFALGKHSVFEFSKDDDGKYRQTGVRAVDTKYNHIVTDTKDNCYITNSSSCIKITFDK